MKPHEYFITLVNTVSQRSLQSFFSWEILNTEHKRIGLITQTN